jgi:hypothetical protein
MEGVTGTRTQQPVYAAVKVILRPLPAHTQPPRNTVLFIDLCVVVVHLHATPGCLARDPCADDLHGFIHRHVLRHISSDLTNLKFT